MRERMERFSKYMEIKGLNDNQVTIDCGLSVGLLGQARKGKSDLGAKAIIDKYHDANSDKLITFLGEYKDYRNYIFRIDERLKKMYGGGISAYWARHTFATLLAELDTSIDTISLALGHSYGSKVTRVYINPDMRKADEAVRRLINYVYRK